MEKGLYAGSFDPVHLGHIDTIRQGLILFKHLTILIADNPGKKYLFEKHERMDLIYRSLDSKFSPDDLSRITIDVLTDGDLCVDYAASREIWVMLRGLRSSEDFNYERSIENINHHLNPFVSTIYITPSPKYVEVSSSLIKTLGNFGRNIDEFVSVSIAEIVLERMRRRE
jgi:pantetheine-phosphate adenylyltransferase